jgi:HPt (histidine-containing phosphotransfer) domain-containing protein
MMTNSGMAEALARLWTKFLPEIEMRLVSMESAVLALDAGTLSDAVRNEAHQAAHKLAGTLGTFGLHRGTELARNAENVLEGDGLLPGTANASDLNLWTGELRSLIDSHG